MNTHSSQLSIPVGGSPIRIAPDGTLQVPDNPVIPFIEGDGIGADITPVMRRVVDAAVDAAYAGARRIRWMEIYAGAKANERYGSGVSLPEETLDALRDYVVSIKGPLMTPVAGGIRSLNVAMRQALDLYVNLRPVRYFTGVPSPVRHPERTDMVIFRENSEDIYVGVEYEARSKSATLLIEFLQKQLGASQIRFPLTSGIGIKPVSQEGSERLIRKALAYAVANDRRSVTLVHKGNIQKYTEGAFREWGYALAAREFGAKPYGKGRWMTFTNPATGGEILVKDIIADAFFQDILLRPEDFDVIATLNLNGDYISDALAAQVGGIGIAPGANLSDTVAVFEATHGTAPDIAGKDLANPGSLILSAEMMLRYLGWHEAADRLVRGFERALVLKMVTSDLARQMGGAKALGTSAFGEVVVDLMPQEDLGGRVEGVCTIGG